MEKKMETTFTVGTIALAIISLGALAYHRFSKMSPDEKKKLTDFLKEHAQQFMENQGGDIVKTLMSSTNAGGSTATVGR